MRTKTNPPRAIKEKTIKKLWSICQKKSLWFWEVLRVNKSLTKEKRLLLNKHLVRRSIIKNKEMIAR